LQLEVKYVPIEELKYSKKTITFSKLNQSFFNFDLSGFLVMEDAKGFVYEEDTPLCLREV
jgi:hypothetical protein